MDLFKCGDCEATVEDLNAHYRQKHLHLSTFKCGYCLGVLQNKTSLMRHITVCSEGLSAQCSAGQGAESASGASHRVQGASLCRAAVTSRDVIHSQDVMDTDMDTSASSETIDLNSAAALVIRELRAKATLTGKALERFQDGCMSLLKSQHADLVNKVSAHLREKGMSEEEIEELNKVVGGVEDVFSGLRTIEDQLKTFAEKFGLVEPKEYYLGTRLEKRLDPKTNEYVQTQVNATFQSVSITDTLKALLLNRKIRDNILINAPSEDGLLKSYVDGYHFKDHPFLSKHQNVIHILIFFDELEVANALGSRTSIHKLGVFFFQILNLPAYLSSKLSSIHLLALAYAEDLKKPGAFAKVLTPFLKEMKTLTSDDGIEVHLDGEVFTLRAVLIAVTADTLAAHDLLGFLGPSAKCFCRLCLITREELREDANTVGLPRTKESHDQHVEEVTANPNLSTQFGVKRICPLNEAPFFHCVEGNVFDAFHDVLEGVAPLVIKLVLRHFICERKLLSIKDFNQRVYSFSYGIPDQKNKPSANFVHEMLVTRKKLKQTGSQMWCLMRALPFLIWANLECSAEDAKHMEMVFLLQDMMKIIFAFEVSYEDLNRLETLIFKHHELFKTLYVDSCVEIGSLEETREDQDDIEEPLAAGSTSRGARKAPVVNFINKFHHLKHYPDMMRRFGPAVRMWCAKFEGRLKIFRQHAAIVCNFINVPKTMAQMFQLSNVPLDDDSDEDSIDFHKGLIVKVGNLEPSLFEPWNLEETEELISTNSATIRGEEYRPGLFVVLSSQTSYPQFGLITDVFIHQNCSVLLCLKPWKVLCLSAKYNCYRVGPDDCSSLSIVNVLSLCNYRAIAPWSSAESDDVYLSPRTIIL